METKIESQLSLELQEMYLENKEWLSDILFLADEMRFFQEIFQKLINSPIKQNDAEKVEFVNVSLTVLQERRNHLKNTLNNRQHVLESMLKDEVKTITIAFIEEDTAIVKEIKALLATDKEVKKELFALIEALQLKTNTSSFVRSLKIQRYPIL